MKKLLNTLYITSEDKYLSLDSANVVIKEDGSEVGRVPLHNLQMIVCFSRLGASPALMGKCAEENISLVFLKPNGAYLARVEGKTRGNVLLRKTQYQVSEDLQRSIVISRNMILGKVYNARWVIERMKPDHSLQVDVERLTKVSGKMYESLNIVAACDSPDKLRGYEGELAAEYFSVFDEMILQQK